MKNLPLSLTIAIWIVGPLWVVGLVALLFGASWEIPAATFAMGILAGLMEWQARRPQKQK